MFIKFKVMPKDTLFCQKQTLNCGGKIINLSSALVMGIINITHDSFYKGSRFTSEEAALNIAEQMLKEGAGILDIGAASTRPGAPLIKPEEELQNLIPIIKTIVNKFPEAIISVDTYNSETAKTAIENGAHIINDISAGEIDDKMFETIAKLNVPYIMMHMQGTPENMQENPSYNNIVKEISLFFAEKIQKLNLLGVNDIIIDPGFGFGKTTEHNYELLRDLEYFRIFEYPLMVGFSRKSMINKILKTNPENALNGTTVLNTIALMKGAKILRVHDVKEAIEAVKLVDCL
jgi:dihydropteroate synthase